MSSATDAELLGAHSQGDPDAFAELFRRHRDRVWAVALRTLGNREDAADAVQEAFIKAMRSVDSFRGDAAVTTWLHRIVVNVCLDQIRAAKRRPTDILADDPGARVATPQRDAFDERDTSIVIHEALRRLPDDQRIAIVLVDIQGLTVAEVAELLSVAEGTVKSRCARGRARLGELLASLRPAVGRNPTASRGVAPEKAPSRVSRMKTSPDKRRGGER